MTAVIPNEMKDEISKVVKELLSLASEEEKKKELEKHLLEAKEKLTEMSSRVDELVGVSEAKDEEIASMKEELEALKASTDSNVEDKTKELTEQLTQLQAKLEEADATLKSVVSERDNYKASLESIEKDRIVEKRMAELSGEKVAFVDEEKSKVQLTKVRDMSDGQFAEYKTDLISIRDLALSSREAASVTEDVPPPAKSSAVTPSVPNVEMANMNNDNVSERFAGLGEKMAAYSRTLNKTGK